MMTNKGVVSVVMPVYNAEEFLADTIETVLNQTYKNLELIIVDDVSTDNSYQVAKEYEAKDKRVKAIRNKANFGGPAGPRNIGVDLAVGEWVAFIDSDDLWHPEKLSWQIKLLEKTGKKFCCTTISNFKNGEEINFREIDYPSYSKLRHSKLIFKDFVPTSSVVVEKMLISETKFKEMKELISVEDYECWLQCHNRIDYSIKLKEPLTYYRLSESQLSRNKWRRLKVFVNMFANYKRPGKKSLGSILGVIFTTTHYSIALYEKLFKKGF